MSVKHNITKYLLAAATLAPIPKNANAENENYRLDEDNGYSFCAKGGIEVMVPSRTVENQLYAKEYDGACMGGFIELGVQNWNRRDGACGEYETHIGYMGRLEYVSFNSRAYNIIEAKNVFALANSCSPGSIYIDPKDYGCCHVREALATFNIIAGIGGKGFTLESNVGAGWRCDNQGNWGPVFVLGTGVGVRLRKDMQLALMYRLNMMPFDNPGPNRRPTNAPGVRNNIELNFTYRMPYIKKEYKKQHTR